MVSTEDAATLEQPGFVKCIECGTVVLLGTAWDEDWLVCYCGNIVCPKCQAAHTGRCADWRMTEKEASK